MSAAPVQLRAPLSSRPELRLLRNLSGPHQVVLCISVKQPADALAVAATLRLGDDTPATWHAGRSRVQALPVGTPVLIEAESIDLRAGTLRVTGVRAITSLAANSPTFYLATLEARQDEAATEAAA